MINCFVQLRSVLRRGWLYWPARTQALLNARRANKGSNKRLKWEYQCAQCKGWFKQADVAVDHIKRVGTLLKKEDITPFVNALFCDVSNLQILCKECHKIKTKEERNASKKDNQV